MQYIPTQYKNIQLDNEYHRPSTIKAINNRTFAFWSRSLFERAYSVFEFDLPENWQGPAKDFLYYCLFRYGFVAVFKNDALGIEFNPCSIKGYDFHYQPCAVKIVNPALKNININLKHSGELNLLINNHSLDDPESYDGYCELLKLTPDYRGIWDIIERFAEQLSNLDNAINLSIINSKFSYVWGAKNKSAAEALKKILDKVNNGEPAVIFDKSITDVPKTKEDPFQLIERTNIKNGYLTTDQLMDLQTILNNFDSEIGIMTTPYQKHERLTQYESESRSIDSSARAVVWLDCLKGSIDMIKKLIPDINLDVKLRYDMVADAGGDSNDNELE